MLHLFLKQSPFIRLVISVITGYYLSDVFDLPLACYILISGITFILLLLWNKRLSVKIIYRYRYLSGILAFIMFTALSAIYWQVRKPVYLNSNSEAVIKVQLIEALGQTKLNYKFEAYLYQSSLDTLQDQKLKGIVYLPINKTADRYESNDLVVLQGRFTPYSKPSGVFTFNYSQYLINQRIGFRFLAKHVKNAGRSERFNVFVFCGQLKAFLREQYHNAGLNTSQLAILNALFLGDKSLLTYEQKSAFSDAGAMHLLAVSGLHVGIIYMIMLKIILLIGFKKNSILSFVFVVLTLWIYALITGFSSSVLRASLMFTILELGRIYNYKTGIFNLLGSSMFIILIIEPLSIYNIGFWLSHVAVAFIVSFYPSINAWLHFKFPPFKWIWSIVAVSIAAQLGTLPISIYAFYEFPLYFILTNILLIPLVAPILILAVLASLFSFSSALMGLLIPALGDLLTLMEQATRWIDSLPYSSITNLFVEWWQLPLIYMVLILLLIYINYRFVNYLKFLLIAFIVFVASFHIHSSTKPNEVLYVSDIKNKSVVNYIGQGQNIIYTSTPIENKEAEFAFKGLWAKVGAPAEYSVVLMDGKQKTKPVVKLIGGESIGILPKGVYWNDRILFDRLILLGAPSMPVKAFLEINPAKQLIVANGWSWYQKKKWLKACSERQNRIHNVQEDGVVLIGL
jgi:competence protein ComEC